MKPFWTTFYSYKGGVGRSLALANTAALLVRRGRRVVLIDFDLEAPGLDSFKEFECVAGNPGVVEYVTEFKETNRAPEITRFVHPCELRGPLRGQLFIMPAGKKDAHYNACRANLSWADLYENHHGEQFVENWKAALDNHYHPDHVFVDSRTGLTDVGSICTLHLPDLVVMLFGLNEQNVKGVAAVAKTIRESEITLRQIAPFFEEFRLPPSKLNESKIRLEWKEKGSDAYFNASSLSDGTLRFLCLTTLLLQPQLPAVVLLDEPELGLHPAAVTLLADLLSAAATRTQVIVATQSVTLVNLFEPESVWAVDREDSQSVFRHLSQQDMSTWMDDYGLGEMWEKNILGARP
ncbi:MAG: AAA family ATPase [Verrucomicrobia bacterium]|nr:AAA family ATPase [Verrucomicrobiota bacterium]